VNRVLQDRIRTEFSTTTLTTKDWMTIRTLIRLTPKTRKTITIYTGNIRDPVKLTTGKASYGLRQLLLTTLLVISYKIVK